MIPNNIYREILNRLAQAEKEHDVRVLYAVESGSRAWGFASPDSDYDVRFIYAHLKEWYLAVDLEKRRDVIEYPIVDDIDLSGWDVRKALRLFGKSNPAIVEWLHSPVVYIDHQSFADRARQLLPAIYSVEKGIYHYRSMAKTNYRGYLKEAKVLLKKYFYVLRPLLSVLWLEKYRSPAPIEFDKLRQLIQHDTTLEKATAELLARKKACKENEKEPAMPVLNAFIEAELARQEDFNAKPKKHQDGMDAVNALFRAVIS
jgi:hypothetical protein